MLMKAKAQSAEFQFTNSVQKDGEPGIQFSFLVDGKVTSFFLKGTDAATMLFNLQGSFKHLLNEIPSEASQEILKIANKFGAPAIELIGLRDA